MSPALDLRSKIRQDTDQCVMCGLCLPHCPTYLETRDEGESPRGRISLMSALASGQLPWSPRLQGHLDHCLACRACEDVCPSQVPYGPLIDATRALIRDRRRRRWARRLIVEPAVKTALTRTAVLRTATRLLRIAQIAGLLGLGRRLMGQRRGVAARLLHYLPVLPKVNRWRTYYPATAREQGQVALFAGCVNPLFDPQGLHAAIRVLNRLGYGVHLPATQVCCGALHQHGGQRATAEHFARRNIAAFDIPGCEAVLSLASGCGATLKEYPASVEEAALGRRAAEFAARCIDISHFLAQARWPDDVTLAPLPLRVAVHEPCTLKRVLHEHTAVYTLLGRLSGAEVVPLPGNAYCCGAAGSYMLTQAAMADRLRHYKLKALAALQGEVLVTSNIGCALHLAAGLRDAGSAVAVMHPVTLLDRCLRASPHPSLAIHSLPTVSSSHDRPPLHRH